MASCSAQEYRDAAAAESFVFPRFKLIKPPGLNDVFTKLEKIKAKTVARKHRKNLVFEIHLSTSGVASQIDVIEDDNFEDYEIHIIKEKLKKHPFSRVELHQPIAFYYAMELRKGTKYKKKHRKKNDKKKNL